MGQPAGALAERYQLQLCDTWQAWFDEETPTPGAFREPAAVDDLLQSAPPTLWSGFMLPDTLPIVGNTYGDWLCARVTEQDKLGEILHWYHGGGDWIPVGRTLAEALLHDVVDQFRPTTQQSLRGAVETTELDHRQQVLERFGSSESQVYFAKALGLSSQLGVAGGSAGKSTPAPAAVAQAMLREITAACQQDHYTAALRVLETAGVSVDAVACDRIEQLLQAPVQHLAQRHFADSAKIAWHPDFVRLLFDVESANQNSVTRLRMTAASHLERVDEVELPKQDWQAAEEIALQVLRRRQDLGWATSVAGWAKQRRGEWQTAAEIYWAGRNATAFSDQSVRIRSHWFAPSACKFAIAQLNALAQSRPALLQRYAKDSYLHAFRSNPPTHSVQTTSSDQCSRQSVALVESYWCDQARMHLAADRPDEAYTAYQQAGWDVGVAEHANYESILSGLVKAARAAGWKARGRVAEAHLNAFRERLK